MSGYPERYIAFDTETRPVPARRKGWDDELTLRLGFAKIYDPIQTGDNKPQYHGFTSPVDFLPVFLAAPISGIPIYVFAHNIGFDLRIIEWFRWVRDGHFSLRPPPGALNAGRWKEPKFIADGYPTLMRFFRADGQRFEIVDTFNWFPFSLAKLGAMIDYPKGAMPRDDADEDEWMDYCRRDVDVMDAALRRLWGWLSCMRFDTWMPTPAGQALLIYKTRHARGRIAVPADPEPMALARKAYYGAVNEPYRLGMCEYVTHQLDVTGLYPSVMLGNYYPCSVRAQGDLLGESGEDPPFTPLSTCAEVWLDSGRETYPVRCSAGTLHVCGKVRTVLCGPELDQAYNLGHVRAVGRWVSFEMATLFDTYVNMFWGLRDRAKRRGDKLIDYTCKALLNTLYGKFGQRAGDWQFAGHEYPTGTYCSGKLIGPLVDRDIEMRVINGDLFTRDRCQEDDRGFVPIAAWVASYARVRMAEYVDMADTSHVLYQLNDCLIVDGEGLGNLQIAGVVNTGRLGSFHYEETYQWINIINTNHVDTDVNSRHAGVKSGSVRDAAGNWHGVEFEGLTEGIFRGSVSSVFTRKSIRAVDQRYSHRYVHADGRTTPWRIDNWEVDPASQEKLDCRPIGPGRV